MKTIYALGIIALFSLSSYFYLGKYHYILWPLALMIGIAMYMADKKIITKLTSYLLILFPLVIFLLQWTSVFMTDISEPAVPVPFLYEFSLALIGFWSYGAIILFKSGLFLLKENYKGVILSFLGYFWLLRPALFIFAPHGTFEYTTHELFFQNPTIQISLLLFEFLLFTGIFISSRSLKEKKQPSSITNTIGIIGLEITRPILIFLVLSFASGLLIWIPVIAYNEIPYQKTLQYIYFFGLIILFTITFFRAKKFTNSTA